MDSITRNLVHIQGVVHTLGQDVEKLRSDLQHATPASGPFPTNQPASASTSLGTRQRRYQYILDRTRSLPKNQFLDLVQEEMQRIWLEEDPRSATHPKLPRYMMTDRLRTRAALAIKDEWVKQGIWQLSFEGLIQKRYLNVGVWKHQELMSLIDDHGLDLEKYPNTYARMCRHRDASRPCHQFRYQVDKVRDRILDEWRQSVVEKESETDDDTTNTRVTLPPAQIDTQAYQRVRKTWMRRRIWDKQWEVLPGQHWRHERPLEELLTPQEIKWYTEFQASWVEPGFSGPHRLVHRVESEREVLEMFERRLGGTMSFWNGKADPHRGLKRMRRSSWQKSLPDRDLTGDDSREDPVSREDETPPRKKRVVKVPDDTDGSSSDGEVPGSLDQSSSNGKRRRAWKSPFVVDDDESSDPLTTVG
ncbi:hypothetical protein PG988_012001 [Apiospora saccharicola]